jgi:signal transduction histidine kinase
MEILSLPKLDKNPLLNLDTLQWALPIFLSLTAITFEIVEHSIEGELNLELSFISEIIIFGFMGPVIIAFLIAWMRQLVESERKAAEQVKTLNRVLEQKVEQRTIELAERNLELAKANRELQHLDQMKSEFVSLVSHELRTPLTTLNGGLELAMLNANTLPEQARHILETMVGESARLTSLVQTILDVSRLEAGRLDINPGPVALRPLMEQAAAIVLIPRNRSLTWEFSPNLPPVLADEVHLEQIIRNLMRNAVKYAPEDKPIHLAAILDDDKVRVSVRDYGPGIPEAYQEYIFERFSRTHAGEDSPPGWGLGLYFARKLILAQGGSIHVASPIWDDETHPGSEFYLLLPIADSSEG